MTIEVGQFPGTTNRDAVATAFLRRPGLRRGLNRMSLVWCLCVCLLLAGLALRRRIQAALIDVWKGFTAKPAPAVVRARHPDAGRRPVAPDPRRWGWPPVRVPPGPDPTRARDRPFPATDGRGPATDSPP